MGAAKMPLKSKKNSLNLDDGSSTPSLSQQLNHHDDLDLSGANIIAIQIDYDECDQQQVDAHTLAGPHADQSQRRDDLDLTKAEHTRRNDVLDQDQTPQTWKESVETYASKSEPEEHNVVAAPPNLWKRRRATRKKGGYVERLQLAIRVSLAVLSYFVVMVYTRQQLFNAIWLGNAFLVITSMKENFGESLLCALFISRDIVVTCCLASVPVLALHAMSKTAVTFVFPPTVAIMAFIIMCGPWLRQKNLMVVVMYIMVAEYSPLNPDPVDRLFALGLAGTILIGCLFGVLSKLIPLPGQEFALEEVRSLLLDVVEDTHNFFEALNVAFKNSAISVSKARQALSQVELASDRLERTCALLAAKSEVAEFECGLLLRGRKGAVAGGYVKGSLSECIAFLQVEQKRINQIRAAVTSRVLGEEITAYHSHLKHAKSILSQGTESERSLFYSSIVQGIQQSILTKSGVMFEVDNPSTSTPRQPLNGVHLARRIRSCKNDSLSTFHRVLAEAEEVLYDSHLSSAGSNAVPPFSYFVRRLQALFGVVSYSERLAVYLESKPNKQQLSRPTLKYLIIEFYVATKQFISQPFPKRSVDNYRTPLKVALGLFVASLWVVAPFLSNRSAPFSFWPGVTVASVNQPTPGSSYMKCIYRLWGTMSASAFALLLVFFAGDDTLSGEFNAAKLGVVTLVTFLNTYLHQKERSYAYLYSSISIGSIMFGSIKNDFQIEGYVMNRITLIVTGLVIFVFFELTVLPKSSKRVMEQQLLDFVTKLRFFTQELRIAVRDVDHFSPPSVNLSQHGDNAFHGDEEGRETSKNNIARLQEERSGLEALSVTSKTHLQSAIDEPDFGFGSMSDARALGETVVQQNRIIEKSELLIYAVQRLNTAYLDHLSREHIFRELDMPQKCEEIIAAAANQLAKCHHALLAVSSGGHIFSDQKCDRKSCLQAAATFRSFEDVRLSMLSAWSKAYHEFVDKKLASMSLAESVNLELAVKDGATSQLLLDPLNLLMITRFATVVSSFLEMCQSLQLMGRQFEQMARGVPDGSKTK